MEFYWLFIFFFKIEIQLSWKDSWIEKNQLQTIYCIYLQLWLRLKQNKHHVVVAYAKQAAVEDPPPHPLSLKEKMKIKQIINILTCTLFILYLNLLFGEFKHIFEYTISSLHDVIHIHEYRVNQLNCEILSSLLVSRKTFILIKQMENHCYQI